MTFKDAFERSALFIMTGVAIYAASQLKELSLSVSELNTNVAVLVERVTTQEKAQTETKTSVSSIEDRLRKVELQLTGLADHRRQGSAR